MKCRAGLTVLAVLLLELINAGCTYAQQQSSHALLIGIGDYSWTKGDARVDSLQGPLNDVELMRNLLENRFDVPKGNIVTLADDQATHSRVEKAFSDLARRVQSGDFVYIYYSGHGSYIADKSDPSGFDQTWVTFGSRSGRLAGLDDLDVRDKEIREWLVPLYKKTIDLVFVSDSCHSATVSRGAVFPGVRAAPPDTRPYPLIPRSSESAASAPGIRIGAARDIETAVEIHVDSRGPCLGKDKCQGAFTWAWVQALQQAKPGETWNDVFKRAYAVATSGRNIRQRPQLEGHGERIVFGGGFPALKPTIAVTAVSKESGTATIAAGSVSGISKGSTYRLFDAETPNRPDLPQIEITAVSAFVSEGKINGGTLRVGDLVTESTHAHVFDPVRLHVVGAVGGDLDKPLVSRIQKELEGLPGFAVTRDQRLAEWVIHIVRPKNMAEIKSAKAGARSIPESFRDQTPEAWVADPLGEVLHERMRIPLKDTEPGIASLKQNLTTFARAQEIMRLKSHRGAASLSVLISVLRPDPACRKDCVSLPDSDGKSEEKLYHKVETFDPAQAARPARRGDVLTFSLKNLGARAYYVYLLDISPDSSIQLIYPRPFQSREDALLYGGESRDLANEVPLLLNATGKETFKIVASGMPIDARLFEQEGFRDAARRSGLNPLERLLAEAMGTRGEPIKMQESDWGTWQADVQVGE